MKINLENDRPIFLSSLYSVSTKDKVFNGVCFEGFLRRFRAGAILKCTIHQNVFLQFTRCGFQKKNLNQHLEDRAGVSY